MMRRMLVFFTVITQVLLSLVHAEASPVMGTSGRYNQTLPGVPLPDRNPALGTLQGFIHSADGVPLAGGDVYFFNEITGPPPAPEKYWRVPDMLGTLDDKGGFSVELPPGKYTIGAIQRKNNHAIIGPPSVGDMYYAGKIFYEVHPASLNNIKIISGAKPFTVDSETRTTGNTVIEGSVSDAAGKPLPNVLVFAHMKPEMNDKPVFVSTRSDTHGVYRLRVAGTGTYYLRVRDIYGGGMPVAGSVMGVYGGDTPKAVTINQGEVVKNVNLTGFAFVKPLSKSDSAK